MKSEIKKTVLSALFIALALVLPFLTGQIREIGKMLCPMHIPVLLCGFICGPEYGMIVGLTAPLLRSAVFGMPVLMPHGVCMAFELAAYGFFAGVLIRNLPKKLFWHYVALILTMIGGRIVKGIVSIPIYGLAGQAYSMKIFVTGTVIEAVPGMILQIIVIPPLLRALKKLQFFNS